MSELMIGNFNTLKILKDSPQGFYLETGVSDPSEVLLPRRYLTGNEKIGESLRVFISYDSDDRLVASLENPLVEVGGFASLQVLALEKVGAFLDWGMPKDLFLPFSEQTRPLRPGQNVVVYVYLDKSFRICATMRIERHLDSSAPPYKEGEEVDLLIVGETDLGFKALINGRHIGLLYSNEIFQPLSIGQKIKAHVKKPRTDGKIDLILSALGHKAGLDIEEKIIKMLREKDGFLPIDDKTSAELIYDWFGVSKKKYKNRLGRPL